MKMRVTHRSSQVDICIVEESTNPSLPNGIYVRNKKGRFARLYPEGISLISVEHGSLNNILSQLYADETYAKAEAEPTRAKRTPRKRTKKS